MISLGLAGVADDPERPVRRNQDGLACDAAVCDGPAMGARERGQNLDDVAIIGRSGHTGARPPGAIGISSIRAGNIVGDHTVAFVSDTETVELTHHAVDRELFASGALRAAHWRGKQPAGLYGMRDVLGFD